MVVVILISTASVFFAWLESSGRYKHGLKIALFLIFLFLALRFNFGNDYMAYLASFHEIKDSGSDFSDFVKPKYEFGWVYLNHLFAPFGFFIMTGFLACLTCIVLYHFIKKYVPSQYYWFAVFLYVFQPYNMLVLSSAMRQAVSVAIFLLAIDFLINRKILFYLILVFFASLFHSSAYFLFPLILLSVFHWKSNIATGLVVIVLFMIPTIWGNFVLEKINIFVSSYFPYYGHYEKQSVLNTGLGFLLTVFLFLMTIYFTLKIDEENLLFFRLAIISFILIPLSLSVEMVSRINFYLQPALMVVYPLMMVNIKKSQLKLLFISSLVLITVYQFLGFFQSETWHNSFEVYHTIFSAPAF